MKKKLIFLQVSEARDKSNFIRKIEELIQVPVGPKDTMGSMLTKLMGEAGTDKLAIDAISEYGFSQGGPKQKVFDSDLIGVIPDPALQMYAIFDLVTVK